MGMDVTNGIVPAAGPSHVRIPPGENVMMSVPDAWTYSIQWTKNGKPIVGATGRVLTFSPATSGDSATYSVSGAPFPWAATGIVLDVVPVGHLGNQSACFELAPNTTQTMGFVVSGTSPKVMLFRVVGPTLKNFGIAKPAPRPRVQCFDSAGRPFGFVHAAIAIDVNALFKSVGAFPVTDAELATVSFDYGSFPPGAYSFQVTDAVGGTALVEVYEMP
jgi:hypothetical protein